MIEVNLEEKLNNVVYLKIFIIIVDNSGKLIYSKYFIEKYKEGQHEF